MLDFLADEFAGLRAFRLAFALVAPRACESGLVGHRGCSFDMRNDFRDGGDADRRELDEADARHSVHADETTQARPDDFFAPSKIRVAPNVLAVT
jgi:hypothetical protein